MTNTLEPPGRPVPPDTGWQDELHNLRWHWCPPYSITSNRGETWSASLIDRPAEIVLYADTAYELRSLIRAHYAANPQIQRTARDHAGLGDCWCGETHDAERSSI